MFIKIFLERGKICSNEILFASFQSCCQVFSVKLVVPVITATADFPETNIIFTSMLYSPWTTFLGHLVVCSFLSVCLSLCPSLPPFSLSLTHTLQQAYLSSTNVWDREPLSRFPSQPGLVWAKNGSQKLNLGHFCSSHMVAGAHYFSHLLLAPKVQISKNLELRAKVGP